MNLYDKFYVCKLDSSHINPTSLQYEDREYCVVCISMFIKDGLVGEVELTEVRA